MNSPQNNSSTSFSERSKKPKLLVVDDEQDNLDLLYRTFRRDFTVFKAESGVQALEVLQQEGEVAVIISDQRMPEMKGTEFLSKTVPQFPDTVRIVLTGFTDVEDLVEAINSGQVYKYITKPWDPEELKGVVVKATQTYDLLKHRSEELRRSQAQNALLATILSIAQQSTTVAECLQPIAISFGENFTADSCVFQLLEHGVLIDQKGIYSIDRVPTLLENDAIAQQAIATLKLQSDQTHLVVPVTYRGEVLALLSLQTQLLDPGDVALVQQCADAVAIALTCIRYYRPT
jgi:response regulator RpfG family c-di-GMP phosphodiesterase